MDQDFQPTSLDPCESAATGAVAPVGRALHWLRRLRLAPLGAGRDAQSGLLDRHAWVERGNRLLATLRWSGHDASVAVFDFRDLLEVRGIYGEGVGAALQRRLVAALRRLAGRHGLAARTGPAQFAVLLPGLDRRSAVEAVHAALGKPCRIELDLPDDELVLVPEVVVDTCAAGELAEAYSRLAVTLARHHSQQERRRSYLRRERERHSRPAPLGDTVAAH